MGNEPSLYQSKIRNSTEVLGGEVRQVRVVIKGLSNKMRVSTRSLRLKLMLFTMSGAWWFWNTQLQMYNIFSALRADSHSVPQTAALALHFLGKEITFCTFALCAFANRQWRNLCLIWGVLLKGGVWWDDLKPGLKACIPWGQGMHSSSKCSAEVQSTVQLCENLGCEQPGGRKRWNECVWWDVCVLKHVHGVGLLQGSGYFTSVITLST